MASVGSEAPDTDGEAFASFSSLALDGSAEAPALVSWLDGNVGVVAITTDRGSCRRIWRLVVCVLGPAIEPGEAATIRIGVRVSPHARKGSTLYHLARVHSPSDSIWQNNTAIARTAVIR